MTSTYKVTRAGIFLEAGDRVPVRAQDGDNTDVAISKVAPLDENGA